MSSDTYRPSIAFATVLLFLGAAPAAVAFQVQIPHSQKLEPIAPSSFHSFGQSLALDGDSLLAGAVDTPSGGPGFVYAFERNGSSYAFQQKFTAPGAPFGHAFGRRLALDGDMAVISATDAAYAYIRTAGAWDLEQQLTPPGSSVSYGTSVAIDGDTIAVGQFGMTAARVVVWVRSGGTWTVQSLLQPEGGGIGTGFGLALALHGDTLVVGANQDSALAVNGGALFVFTRSGATWSQRVKLTGNQPFPQRRLGTSVDVQPRPGGQLEIVSGGAGNLASRVITFLGSGASWTQSFELAPVTGGSESWFGGSVAVDGDWLTVGAWRASTGSSLTGMGTLYRRSGSQWIRQTDLVPGDAAENDGAGFSVGTASGVAAIGAPYHDGATTNSGAIYAFDLASTPVATYCHGDGSGTACPCNNESAPGTEGGCSNSIGMVGLLLTNDSLQAGNDKLMAHASGLVPGQPALLFAGTQAIGGGAGIHFGDGLRCAGVSVVRLGIQTPGAGGEASYGPGLQLTGGWSAGDTRYFQVWYRDPLGGPCASGFNLTNGLRLEFVP